MHFISGLPRSGSTLLASILGQNPAIHTGMSSMLGPIFEHMLHIMRAHTELTTVMSEEQRGNVIRGMFDGYYWNVTDKTIIDTNRAWCGRIAAVARLYPESKVIACVRDPVWILDSIERLIRKHPLTVSRLISVKENVTVFSRVEWLMNRTGLVGGALAGLKEAFYGDESERLIIVDYDDLASDPKTEIARIYDGLKLPSFEHDFDNVACKGADALDAWLGVPGLHELRRKVALVPRETIIPPELVEKFSNQCFWR